MSLPALRDIFHNGSTEQETHGSGMPVWVPGDLPETAFERAERGLLPNERGADKEAAAERAAAAHRLGFEMGGAPGGERGGGWSGEVEVVNGGEEIGDSSVFGDGDRPYREASGEGLGDSTAVGANSETTQHGRRAVGGLR